MQISSASATMVAVRILEVSHSPALIYTMLLSIKVCTAILMSRLNRSRDLTLGGSDSVDECDGKRVSLSRFSESCWGRRACLCLDWVRRRLASIVGLFR
jgi:hypothetical protein